MALFRLPELDWIRCEEQQQVVKETVRPRPKTIIKREKKRQEKLRRIKQRKPAIPP